MRTTRELEKDAYPFAITHLSHGDHSWTESVVLEGDIVDVVAP